MLSQANANDNVNGNSNHQPFQQIGPFNQQELRQILRGQELPVDPRLITERVLRILTDPLEPKDFMRENMLAIKNENRIANRDKPILRYVTRTIPPRNTIRLVELGEMLFPQLEYVQLEINGNQRNFFGGGNIRIYYNVRLEKVRNAFSITKERLSQVAICSPGDNNQMLKYSKTLVESNQANNVIDLFTTLRNDEILVTSFMLYQKNLSYGFQSTRDWLRNEYKNDFLGTQKAVWKTKLLDALFRILERYFSLFGTNQRKIYFVRAFCSYDNRNALALENAEFRETIGKGGSILMKRLTKRARLENAHILLYSVNGARPTYRKYGFTDLMTHPNYDLSDRKRGDRQREVYVPNDPLLKDVKRFYTASKHYGENLPAVFVYHSKFNSFNPGPVDFTYR
jgi:hypothetical protein